MAWDVTTEWEDIHVRLGNFLPREKKPTLAQLTNQAIESAQNQDQFQEKKLEELDELDDDFDQQFLRQYKQKRMAELRLAASRPRFGALIEIDRTQYVKQVNQSPSEVFVVLHLYSDTVSTCVLLNRALSQLAPKFWHGRQCNQRFRDQDCPTVLIYKNGEIFVQMAKCGLLFGGNSISAESVEWVLAQKGILETELEEKPKQQKTVKRAQRSDLSDSDDDREYMRHSVPKYKFRQ